MHRGMRGDAALKGIFLSAALALNAVCTLILMEAVCRGSYSLTMVWLIEGAEYAAACAGMILLTQAALVLLLGRVAPALMLNGLFYMWLAVVHNWKLMLRSDPFRMSDLLLLREGFTAGRELVTLQDVSAMMTFGVTVTAVCVPLLFAGIRVLRGRPVRRLALAAALAAAAAAYGCALTHMEGKPVLLAQDDYTNRGFIIAFLDGDDDLPGMTEPEGYSEAAVQALLSPYEGGGEEPEVKPNILYIMSESLYDLTPYLPLSEDPMAYFRQLQAQHHGGRFLTKVIGGGTAKVEYEVLTGYRIEDTNGVAYNMSGNVVRQGMDTVVSLLEGYGYATQAIHPNIGGFYFRRRIYSMMGFDSVLFSEELPKPPAEAFPFPSDSYLYEQIIRAYEARPQGQPWFCFAVTYQNHGGYSFESGMNDVQVLAELEGKAALNARNYVNMVKLSDEALRELIAYFDAQQEPTVIVIWGDHAPTVSQFALDMPSGAAGRMPYYTTPYLVYSNYGLDASAMPDAVTADRMSPCVMRMLGFDRDAYYNYLASEDAASLTGFDGLIAQDGQFVSAPELYKEEAQRRLMIHYDRLQGRQDWEGMR